MISIVTRKLSTSTYNGNTAKKDHHMAKVPSFGPQSPTSNISTVRNHELVTGSRPWFNFAITSVGGSTNRFSKAELP